MGRRGGSTQLTGAPGNPVRFSFRDTEDLLAQRGITVSYETIRQWCRTCGPEYARTLRRRRGRLGDTWYLDELFVSIQGRRDPNRVKPGREPCECT